MTEIITQLLNSYKAATSAAHPDKAIKRYVPPLRKNGRLIVIGAGKAAAAMAAAFEQNYHGAIEGMVITRYGHSLPTRSIKVVQAAHPVPDETGRKAVGELLRLLQTASPADLIINLISGGGTSLLSAPVDDIELSELQNLYTALLKSGADITQMNIIRKHLNKALGGGLALAAPNTPMITLAISDVTGDDPSIIASGASVPDPSTLSQARDILNALNIEISETIKAALNNPKNETPEETHPAFINKSYQLIATPLMALEAAKTYWQELGYDCEIWQSEMTGDCNDCALKHIEYIKALKSKGLTRPIVILSGGETTVKVTGSGKGGPNQQFMLQAAINLNDEANIYGIACDTDGIDGSGDAAGAFITPQTLSLATAQSLSPQEYLNKNDSYHFFEQIGQLIKTGPSHTNVNDYRAFIIMP